MSRSCTIAAIGRSGGNDGAPASTNFAVRARVRLAAGQGDRDFQRNRALAFAGSVGRSVGQIASVRPGALQVGVPGPARSLKGRRVGPAIGGETASASAAAGVT